MCDCRHRGFDDAPVTPDLVTIVGELAAEAGPGAPGRSAALAGCHHPAIVRTGVYIFRPIVHERALEW